MRIKSYIVGGVLVLLASSALIVDAKTKSPVAGKTKEQVVNQGDPVVGRDKAEAERCQECHGREGHGPAAVGGVVPPIFAKLAGQSPEYIVKQVQNFRSGIRKNDTMTIVVKDIEDEDLIDIAAYFASQKKMQGSAKDDNPLAKNLFDKGDAKRAIAPCASCHGAAGKGDGPAGMPSPVIGGQQKAYLREQLQDWRSGKRVNSTSLMNQTAKALSDADIEALSDYISGL